MSDLEQRVDALEKKIKLLEETLETLKNMNLSEQMEGYIQAKSRAVKMVDLLNQVSDEPSLDIEQERLNLERIKASKTTVDNQISQALKNTKTFSDAFPDNSKYFDYEAIGTGLRITGYSGFDSDRVIVPKEINGQPVISIGEKAFKNAPFSELILPKSIQAIRNNAFEGCKNLTHIALPEGLLGLGKECFSKSGLEEFDCPDSMLYVSEKCFMDCKNLSRVHLGKSIARIDFAAFSGCSSLSQVLLGQSIKKIDSCCFLGTSITTMVFPEEFETISESAFGSPYHHYHYNNDNGISCVFLGTKTEVTNVISGSSKFGNVSLIYCLPGSNIQKYAREHNIPIKPLSEFKWEDYE